MDNLDRCPHCPHPQDRECRGSENRRYCQLVDPEHADYDPAYIAILDPPKPPPLAQQAANLWGAVGRIASAAWNQEPILLGEAEQRERLATCQACDKWRNWQCTVCGCSGLKLHLATEVCPEGKWPSLAPATTGQHG